MLRPFAALLVILTLAPLALTVTPKSKDLVHATLLADTSAVTPGRPFTVAVLLKIAPGWHVYWKNPGDSGQATSLSVDLPDAFKLSPTQFPLPTRFSLPGDITNFGYEDELLLTTTITPPLDLLTPVDGVHINAKLSFLVCNPDQCLPGSRDLSLVLPVSAEIQPANEDLFNRWRPLFPDPANKIATIKTTTTPPKYTLDITWTSPVTKLEFFPGPADSLNVTNVILSSSDPTHSQLTFNASPLSNESKTPPTLESLLTYTTPDGTRRGIELPIILNPKPSQSTNPHESTRIQKQQ